MCSQIVLKCLYLARIGRPDILWTWNKLARSVTKWTGACDRRLGRLIVYFHHASNYQRYCHVGNTAQHRRFGLFQRSAFAEDFEDSNSRSGERSGGISCIFGSRFLYPLVGCVRSKRQYPTVLQDQNYLVGCWIENGRTTCFGHMGCGGRSGTFIEQYQITSKPSPQQETVCDIPKGIAQVLLKASLSCTSLKTLRQWSKWSLMAEVQLWNTFPEPTELLLIGF